MLLISTGVQSQSISVSKVYKYLEEQNQTEISKDLLKLGFQLTEKKETTILKGYGYAKKSEYGVENFNVAINDELFSVIYKPSTANMYSAIKEKVLTKDFVYSYSYQVTKYYENDRMRIGVNDTSKVISFFVIKK